MQNIIAAIHDIPIHHIIEKYIELKPAGINFKAKCPFPGHAEKTASFTVSPGKNICWCFGCNRGGDAISFVQIFNGYNKPFEAIQEICKKFNISIPEHSYEHLDEETYRKKEEIKIINHFAQEYYTANLFKKENALALEYLLTRVTRQDIEKWQLGFAENSWTGFFDYATSKGFKTDSLLSSGLVSQKNNKVFDFLRNRIIFPVQDRSGGIIAFAGRTMEEKKDVPKYLNTPETVAYSKKAVLYGLNLARKTIIEKKGAYLVEGYFDVIRMHQIGIENTVAPCGTAFTDEQIDECARLCDSFILIGDGDDAGMKSMLRSGPMIIDKGLNCNVIPLLSDAEKTDPDSLFKTKEIFREYKEKHLQDFILWLTGIKAEWIKNYPDRREKSIAEISNLIAKYNSATRQEDYINQVSKIIPSKKLWQQKIRNITKAKESEDSDSLPAGINLEDFYKYGFYEYGNKYYFKTKSAIIRGSNFVMKPLFHIQSTLNAKRLYEITNEFGHREIIELPQKDLVSLQSFKLRVESLGNFLWESSETELNRLKRFLYEKTETCVEIIQLGWQRHGFYAWANGIFNGEFKATDKNGIVEFNNKNYYLPAFSSIYSHDDLLFVSERRFVHHNDTGVSFYDYTDQLMKVFGKNAAIAVCFYMASLFRDIIVKKFNFFPILNLFGPKGAGKTELAVSILQFFGRQSKGPNLNNTSKAALADHVAQFVNAVIHIDEYKNNIDYEKIEFLKGLWDGTGRTRMNMDKDKKKETTAVDSGIIFSGQEMPTADNALFSRLVYLTFHKTEYTDKEKALFNRLKDVEKSGLTHITHEILMHRSYFLKNYFENYDKTIEDMMMALGELIIEDRILRNWVILISSYLTLRDKVKLPFNYNDILIIARDQLVIQNQETKRNNEVSTFWNIVQYMYSDGHIQEGVDYKIEFEDMIETDLLKNEWKEPRHILYMQHTRIFTLYRKHGRQAGEKILPTDSIDYYLRTDKRFLGKKKSVAFRDIDPKTGIEKEILRGDGTFRKKRKITKAYCFLYDELNIDLTSGDITDIEENEYSETENEKKIPF